MSLIKQSHVIRWVVPFILLMFLLLCPQPIFADGTISFEEDEYSIEIGDYEYIYLATGEADESTWHSSNDNVVAIESRDSYGIYLEAVGAGSSVISVRDSEGNTAECTVTVTIPEWELYQTSFEDVISNGSGEVGIETTYWDFDFSATSSNKKVAEVDVDNSAVYLQYQGVGTSVITVMDKFGRKQTLNVKLTPAPLTFEQDTQTNYTDYEDNDTFYIYPDYGDNIITSVSSSNTGVLKVRIEKDDDGSWIEATPVGAGTATITARDQYNQTGTITITIAQKFIDEMKYLYLFDGAFGGLYYGDREAWFTASSADFKGTTITAIIGGKKYTATYNGYYDEMYEYVIKNIPVLPVGTAIKYTLSKGKAVYSGESEIMAGDIDTFGWLELSSYSYTYSGKAITPSVSLEYWYNNGDDSKYLRRGTDYSVVYTNNVNVGTAKVKVTGIGNYRSNLFEYFTIVPKGTSISKLVKAKKAFTVKWKKQTAKMSKTPITGYQIRYSLKKNMSSSKIVTVKGYKSKSKKIKKLKRKKNYYVQIRTYKTVNNKNYYSSWSAKKKVKTK